MNIIINNNEYHYQQLLHNVNEIKKITATFKNNNKNSFFYI